MKALFLSFPFIYLLLLALISTGCDRAETHARERPALGPSRRRLYEPRLIGQHPPPVRVALPVPSGGRRWRRQEPQPGSADPPGLLAKPAGAAEIAATGREAREREPARLRGGDLRLECSASLAAKRSW